MTELVEAFVGHYAMLPDRGMEYQVKIVDIKNAYGVLRCQVQPMVGSGQAWVDASSLRMLPAATS